MNHRKTGRKLGRVRRQRKALIKTLLGSLILEEKIDTTEAKSKEIKMHIDQIINKGKLAVSNPEKKVAIIRQLDKDIPKVAIDKLMGDFISKFQDRNSGYTRIIKTGARKSDAAPTAIIEFV